MGRQHPQIRNIIPHPEMFKTFGIYLKELYFYSFERNSKNCNYNLLKTKNTKSSDLSNPIFTETYDDEYYHYHTNY